MTNDEATYTVKVSHLESVGYGRNARAVEVVDVAEHGISEADRPAILARCAGLSWLIRAETTNA